MLCPLKNTRAQNTDWQIWSGMFVRTVKPDHRFNFSGEYQIRLNDNFKNLKSHFIDLNTYYKFISQFEVNAGYRFTIRPDRNENRLMAGLLWRQSLGKEPFAKGYDKKIIIIHQLQYQHDFNIKFNDILTNSNSIRYMFWILKPINKTLAPFAAAAVLYTWNNEYTGLEKIRFVAGIRISRSNADRIKIHYVYEKKNSVDSAQYANIIWLRYEILIH